MHKNISWIQNATTATRRCWIWYIAEAKVKYWTLLLENQL